VYKLHLLSLYTCPLQGIPAAVVDIRVGPQQFAPDSALLDSVQADCRAVLCCAVLCCAVLCCVVFLQVHVRHLPASGNSHLGQNWLADLTAAWKEAGLWITRAKVRTSLPHQHSTFIGAGTMCNWLPLCMK
jgi:hypothetical protein